MEILRNLLKFMVASTLIIGGVVLGGTVWAAKSVDGLGDKLQQKLHK